MFRTAPRPCGRQTGYGLRVCLMASTAALAAAGGLAGCDSGDANVAALVAAVRVGMEEAHNAELRVSSKAKHDEATARVKRYKTRRLDEVLTVTASVNPNHNRIARVAPRVEGQLTVVAANLGDQVEAGQELAIINSIPMGEALAEYRRAESEFRLAATGYERTDGLYGRQVVARRFWQDAKATLERASAGLRLASDRLRTLGGLPDSGKPEVTISAPFAGAIIEKAAVVGELARPEKPLFTVADLSTVWIEADILEADIDKLVVGSAATVRAPAYPGRTFPGVVTHLSSILDRQTRTVKARIETPNPERKLYLNMFVTATIELPPAEASPAPEAALAPAREEPELEPAPLLAQAH
jgi:cobalt-zinc-cadmium efflux system membrane fusion protein